MKVTVDTRHDSLEEALATVHAAFGSSATQPAPAAVASPPAPFSAAARHVPREPGHARRRLHGQEPRGLLPQGPPRRPTQMARLCPPRDVPAAHANRTHAAAQPAETSRQSVPAKKAAESRQKPAAIRQAPSQRNAGKRTPAKKSTARKGTKSTSSMYPTTNIAPPGQADAITALPSPVFISSCSCVNKEALNFLSSIHCTSCCRAAISFTMPESCAYGFTVFLLRMMDVKR